MRSTCPAKLFQSGVVSNVSCCKLNCKIYYKPHSCVASNAQFTSDSLEPLGSVGAGATESGHLVLIICQ